MNTAVYIYTKGGPDAESSVRGQAEACRRLAVTNGLVVGDEAVFVDIGLVPEGLRRLLESASRFDCVIAHDRRRFGRNPRQAATVVSLLESRGVRSLFVLDRE